MEWRRGWCGEADGWWRNEDGDFQLKFTVETEEKLLHRSNSKLELQRALQHATHVRSTPTMRRNGLRPVLDVMRSYKLSLLESIQFDCVRLNNGEVTILTEAIGSSRFPSLKELKISNGYISDGHLALANAMASGKTLALEKLSLNSTHMVDNYWEAYTTALVSGKVSSLTDISFKYNKIGANGARGLGWAIQCGQLKALTHLDLCGTFIKDSDMIELAAAFQAPGETSMLPNIHALLLSGNSFTEVGLSSLAKALESGRLNSLKFLDVSGSSNPSKEGAKALVSALASNNCLVVHIEFAWYKFPALARRKTELIERNIRHMGILAGLLDSPKVPAAFGKVYLCGSPKVGKTTLRKALQRSVWESLCTWERRPHEEERTRGIDISQISRKGKKQGENPLTLLVWDMAGQEEYHVVHNAFFPDLGFSEGKATTFVVVCTSENLKQSMEELEYWLRYIASSCDKTLQNHRHVFVVVNNIGGDRKVWKNAPEWKKLLEDQRDKFKTYLEIRTDLFLVDVRKRRKVDGLKDRLLEHSRNLLRNEEVPQVCRYIQQNLTGWSESRKEFPVLHWDQFVVQVHRSIGPWAQNLIEAATKYLNEAGVLIYVDKKFPPDWGIPYQKLVVLDPNWLSREIIGNVFLPLDMVSPSEHLFRTEVDTTKGSIFISDFKKFFKSLVGEWSNSQLEDLTTILLWLGLCYKGRNRNVFIPSLIAENGAPGYPWCSSPPNSQENGSKQWVMGFSVEHQKSEVALAPISLWHRFQVELAQTPRFNGHPDNDFVADKYFLTFSVDYMNVLIEVNANQGSPTFDEISIFVKPKFGIDNLDGDERKQLQVDLASDLVETLLRHWNEVCPGVEYLHRVVWPWPVCWPSRPTLTPTRNVEVAEVKKWVQEHGLGRQMQWEVGSDNPIREDQLLSKKDKIDVVESVEGSLRILRQGMREAVKLRIFPPDVLTEEVSCEEATTLASGRVERVIEPVSPTGRLVLSAVRRLDRMDKKLDNMDKKLDNLEDLARQGFREVLKKQKELLHKLQDTEEIFLQDREITCPKLVYLGNRNSSSWATLKEALSPYSKVRLHFACEARYNDYRPHAVKDQHGLDVSRSKEWARTIGPWLKVSLTVLFISAKVTANIVMPGLGLIMPDFGEWQQASSLSEGMALGSGFSKEELDKHMMKGMGLDDNQKHWEPRDLYGRSREAMTRLLGRLSPKAFSETFELRKVCLKYGDGSLYGTVWICTQCFEQFRRSHRLVKMVREL